MRLVKYFSIIKRTMTEILITCPGASKIKDLLGQEWESKIKRTLKRGKSLD